MNEEISGQVFIGRGIYGISDPNETRKKYKRSGESERRVLKAYKAYNPCSFSSPYRTKLSIKEIYFQNYVHFDENLLL